MYLNGTGKFTFLKNNKNKNKKTLTLKYSAVFLPHKNNTVLKTENIQFCGLDFVHTL